MDLANRQQREHHLDGEAARADRRPIGVFDSSLGGLTVARAVRRAFPHEPLCYLGDTARVPYGTKSPETVRLYARQSIAFLLSQNVKIIIAACNTVSAAALPFLEEKYDVPVLGVVEMGAEAAVACNPKRIGVIGTETTIASQAYIRAIERRAPDVEVIQKACPLFVPMIEELWLDHAITRLTIQEYLSPMRASGIDTLILGCTHYPLLRNSLAEFFGPSVRLIDSAETMVVALRKAFQDGSLLASHPSSLLEPNGAEGDAGCGHHPSKESRYYFTDRGTRFQAVVGAIMDDNDIHIEQISSEVLADALSRPRLEAEA